MSQFKDLLPRPAQEPISLSILSRVPVEIFSRIFALGASDSSVAIPCAVARVCKRWRTVVLNTPEAWSYIRVNRPHPHPGINYWLTRSGATPLTIRISAYAGLPATTAEAFNAILAPLLPHAHRWKYFQVSCYMPEFLFEPLRKIAPDMAVLTTLEITPHSFHRERNSAHPTPIFSRPPPLLRTLDVTRVSLGDTYFLVSSATEHLNISSPGRERVDPPVQLTLHILRVCASKLTTLCLSAIQHDLNLSKGSPPIRITLPRLFKLELSQITSVDLLIQCLTVPMLQELKIERCQDDMMSIMRHLEETKSCQKMHSLILVNMGLVDEDRLIKWLGHMSDLHTLTLKIVPVTEKLVDALTTHLTDSDFLCPDLENLEFDRQPKINAETLVPLVQAREDAGRRLKHLVVRNRSTPAQISVLKQHVDKVN